MDNQYNYDEVAPEQASETTSYREYLLDRYELMCDIAINLRKSYLHNRENRDAHFALISISCELWNQLFPKIQKSDLKGDFKKWIPFVLDPRLFLERKYENMIWLFLFHIRMGFEHLSLTNIE